MKKYAWIWVVVGAIVLVVIAYSAGQGSNSSVSPNTVSSVVDKEQACTQEAESIYSGMAFQDSASTLSNEKLTYRSHYNSAQGKCFFLGKDNAVDTYANETLLAETFFDADTYYNGNHIGNIASYSNVKTNTYPPTIVKEDCMINGTDGCTYQQFASFINSEMQSAILSTTNQ